jgi:hypothetical protein
MRRPGVNLTTEEPVIRRMSVNTSRISTSRLRPPRRADDPQRAAARLAEVDQRRRRWLGGLPPHRDLLEHVARRGLPGI